jgi:hypothetical protein
VRWKLWLLFRHYGRIIPLSFLVGMRLTVIAALLFAAVGFTIAPAPSTGGADLELQHFLRRPIYLILCGSTISYWVGFEIMLYPRVSDVRIHAFCALFIVDRKCYTLPPGHASRRAVKRYRPPGDQHDPHSETASVGCTDS